MSKAYEEFKTYLDRAMALKTAMTLFEWDNETLAPKEAGELTSNVIGTLSGEYFQAVTNDRMKALVKELQAERGLDEVQAANVREVADELEQLDCIPRNEYEDNARLVAKSTAVWSRAKKDNDFDSFAPTLKTVSYTHLL